MKKTIFFLIKDVFSKIHLQKHKDKMIDRASHSFNILYKIFLKDTNIDFHGATNQKPGRMQYTRCDEVY